MRLAARVIARAQALFRRTRLERDMDSELRFHLAARIDDLRRAGLSRDAAEAQARTEFGDPLRWKEECRDARGVRLLDELRADVRYGLRWLARSPGFAVAAVLSLGLGIGANTAVFSLLDTVLLKSLPVARPQELVVFTYDYGQGPAYGVSFRMVEAFRRQSRRLLDTAASSGRFAVHVVTDGAALPGARGQLVSGNYYSLLGVPAALGRLILPDDDRAPGASAVAVLSHAYWQRQFGGDPTVLGRVVRLNGHPFTIVGVTPPEFFGTHVGERVDIAMPIAMQVQAMPETGGSWIEGDGAYQFWLEAIGRLAPGATTTQAQAELEGLFRQQIQDVIALAGPKARALANAKLVLVPGGRGLSELRRRFSQPLAVVMAVVVLVLLLACANLATLLLARASVRQREMAVRVSLGAGRGRLVRQMLTESVVLALAGGLVGLALASWTGRALATALVDGGQQALDVAIDLRVLAFTLGVSMATALLFGLVPALGASRIAPSAALTMGRQASGEGRGRARVGRLLVAVQVAVSLLLLVGAGLFVRTLMNLHDLDVGFQRERVLVTRVEPRGSNQKQQAGARLRGIYDDLLERVRALPGVRAASLAGATPLGSENTLWAPWSIDGYVPRPGEEMRTRLMQIFPDYFAATGVPILAGREFVAEDNDARAPGRAIINATMATRYFGSPQAAIGRRLAAPPTRLVFTIVGVVADTRDRGVREAIEPLAYSTFAHTPTGRGQMTLIARVVGDEAATVSMVRDQVRAADPDMPLREIETVAHRLEASLRQERLVAWLSSGFGLLALLLACVGLYGVMAYAVARRHAEFGLRMALGAAPGDLRGLVLRETWGLVAIGVLLGVPLSLAASRAIAGMLFGLAPTDPATLMAAVFVLASVATLAGYLPARRAARVDPLVALRQD